MAKENEVAEFVESSVLAPIIFTFNRWDFGSVPHCVFVR